MYNLRDSITETDELQRIHPWYCLPNEFYSLPMSSWLGGIHWCTPWETPHVFDQRLISYITGSFHDILGEKTTGNARKIFLNKYFIIVAGYFNRQSEKDSPCRLVKILFTDSSRVSAKEKVGNTIVFL